MTQLQDDPSTVAKPGTHTGLLLLAGLVLYLGVAAWISSSIYASSADGAATVLGEAIGTLVIPMAVAFFANKRSKSGNAYLVALFFSALILVTNNWSNIKSGLDIKRFKSEMATATPNNYSDILKNSTSEFGKVLNQGVAVSQEAYSELTPILADLDDDRIAQGLDTDTLNNRAKMIVLTDVAESKLKLALAAGPKINAIFADADTKIQKVFASLSPNDQASALDGYRTSREKVRKLIIDFVNSYVSFYQSLIKIYGMLAQQNGNYEVRDGSVLFANDASAAEYNKNLSALQRASKQIGDIQSELQAQQKQSLDKLVNLGRN